MFSFMFFLVTQARSAPIDARLQDAATNHTVLWDTLIDWSDSPSYRGTSDILWSCLVTIFASIFTAIHLDIPLYRVSKWSRLKLRLRWAAVLLVHPTLGLHMILYQYLEARKLYKKLKEENMKSSESETVSTSGQQYQPEYDMSYAFWVAMGGFVIDTKNIHGDYDRVALTTSGVAFLAQHGHPINISKEQIADRSKANSVAKLFVCVQVSWMLLQVFVRLGAGYPITLLEIHTAIQVGCALTIYALCWNKPFDVERPLVVDASNFEDLLAYMMMASLPIEKAAWPVDITRDRTRLLERLPGDSNESGITLSAPTDYYFNIHYAELSILILDNELLLSDKQIHKQSLELSGTITRIVSPAASTQNIQTIQDVENDNLRIESSKILSREAETTEEIASTQAEAPWSASEIPCCFRLDSASNCERSPATIRRRKLCAQALLKHGLVDPVPQERYARGNTLCKDLHDPYVDGSTTSWLLVACIVRCYNDKTGFYTTSLFTIIFGSIYLALWNFPLPSDTEAFLWKIAAAGLMIITPGLELIGPNVYFLRYVFPGFSFFTPIVSYYATDDSRQLFFKSLKNFTETKAANRRYQPISYAWESQDTWMRIWTIISCFVVICYMMFESFVCLYITIESFISLRAVPLGALSTTPWVQAIPHI